MTSLIDPTLKALKIAGDLSGIPFLSTALDLVQSIKENCDKVQVHTDECHQLAEKAGGLAQTFQEHAPCLAGAQLAEYASKIEDVLKDVQKQTAQWSRYGRIRAFFRDSDIDREIKQCTAELDTAFAVFQVDAMVLLNMNQEEARLITIAQSDKMDEVLEVLKSPDEIRQVADLQKAGNPLTGRFMDAGEQRLKDLRRNSGMIHSEAYKEMEHSMSLLYSLTGIPPKRLYLDGDVTRSGDQPYISGMHSEIWVGYWLGDQKVAMKAMRMGATLSEKSVKQFTTEMNVWSKLSHKNILPLLGIVTDIGDDIHLISPWQDNGNLLGFIKKHSTANRLHLLSGAADGLTYLHSEGVIHGNVRCANILVTAEGIAVICDFGISEVHGEFNKMSVVQSLTSQDAVRWVVPEILSGEVTASTSRSDVYSFAMTMLECFTLQCPFVEVVRDSVVIFEIAKGPFVPSRPQGESAARWITDEVWGLMMECWNRDPVRRPDMRIVANKLKDIELQH